MPGARPVPPRHLLVVTLGAAAALLIASAGPALATLTVADRTVVAAMDRAEAAVSAGDGEPGSLVVTLSAAAPPADLGDAVHGKVESVIGPGVVEIEVDPADTVAAARQLAARPDVALVEPNVRYSVDAAIEGPAVADAVASDPWFELQEGIARARVDVAWDTTKGSEEVTIAVLDTGVQPDHEDLAASLVPGYNFVEGNTDTADRNGHGTRVASVAAGVIDNGVGVAGACGRCRIMPVKVLGDDGTGYLSAAAAGVRWATDHGADVISMSLSGEHPSATLADAAADARAAGVFVLASAGNQGTDVPRYPAADAGVLAVAALDGSAEVRAAYSSYGQWVDVVAPGRNGAANLDSSTYSDFYGTSSSTPLVAGAVGLLRSAVPSATPDEIEAAVTSTSTPVDYVEHGRVDAGAAVAALVDGPGPLPEPTPTPAPTPVPEDPGDDPERLAHLEPGTHRVRGTDRTLTAVALSRVTFAPGVEKVYVVTGGNFPDGLAASGVAGMAESPVLLTDAALDPAVAEEIERLSPTEIVVVGGTGAVDAGVVSSLEDLGVASVRRVSGDNRYATAARLAAEAFPSGVGTVLLADGGNFPDALAAGAVAPHFGAPVLLTPSGQLHADTAAAIRDLGAHHVVVLGGAAAVGEDVVAELRGTGLTTRRLSGSDRYATSAAVSAAAYEDAQVVYLASGATFADALAGGAAAGFSGGPLLTTGRDDLPDVVAAEIARLDPDRVVILGGTGAVQPSVLGELPASLAGTNRPAGAPTTAVSPVARPAAAASPAP